MISTYHVGIDFAASESDGCISVWGCRDIMSVGRKWMDRILQETATWEFIP